VERLKLCKEELAGDGGAGMVHPNVLRKSKNKPSGI